MSNDAGKIPQHDRRDMSEKSQSQGIQSKEDAKSSSGSRFEDRSGGRTNTGSSTTDMQGRERYTHTNQGEKPTSSEAQNTGNTATTPAQHSSNERNVTAHNSGDQPNKREEEERDWNQQHQQRRKAS